MRPEFIRAADVAEDNGWTIEVANAWLNRHGVPRFVRTDDVDYAKAAQAPAGNQTDNCKAKGRDHRWDSGTDEDPLTLAPIRWCTRKGCGVGVTLVPAGPGKTRAIYRHRTV